MEFIASLTKRLLRPTDHFIILSNYFSCCLKMTKYIWSWWIMLFSYGMIRGENHWKIKSLHILLGFDRVNQFIFAIAKQCIHLIS